MEVTKVEDKDVAFNPISDLDDNLNLNTDNIAEILKDQRNANEPSELKQ